MARTLTQDEIKVFLNACDGSPIGLELTLMLMLGLRRGEALGLRFIDIDFERRIAHIQQQYTTCGKDKTGKPQWGIRSPKTKESDRIIGIPSLVLQKLIERQKVAKYDLVCCNEDGSPRNINTLEHGLNGEIYRGTVPISLNRFLGKLFKWLLTLGTLFGGFYLAFAAVEACVSVTLLSVLALLGIGITSICTSIWIFKEFKKKNY